MRPGEIRVHFFLSLLFQRFVGIYIASCNIDPLGPQVAARIAIANNCCILFSGMALVREGSLTLSLLLPLLLTITGIESLTASLTSDRDPASSSSLPGSAVGSLETGSVSHPATSRSRTPFTRIGNYSFPDAAGNFTLTSFLSLSLPVRRSFLMLHRFQ